MWLRYKEQCNNSDVIRLWYPTDNCAKVQDFKSLSGLSYLNLVDYLSVSKDIVRLEWFRVVKSVYCLAVV